jgi:hypothetical protein
METSGYHTFNIKHPNRKPTMLNYLRRTLYNWLQQEDPKQHMVELKPLRIDALPQDRMLSSSPLNLHLYRANGGWIVETSNHNNFRVHQGLGTANEESKPKLHIIHDDQELGTAIGKIIFMENLQK